MLEQSLLFNTWATKLASLPADPGLEHSFARLRSTITEHSKVIVHIFPEYTPHDATRHLEQLFVLADRILGATVYNRLNAAEMSLFVFGLYGHDWGMAVGREDRDAISGVEIAAEGDLLPDEPSMFQKFRGEALRLGKTDDQIWEDYVRHTHARRSGYRLRRELRPLGHSFAEMVARVAEAHVLDLREVRDPEQYPQRTALFGEVANVAAIATFVRLVDLLDLAEDRTPFALWSIIRPRNDMSRTEWKKHRALAPVAISEHVGIKQVLITGTTDDSDVFAALADLRTWVDNQFADSVAFLRNIGNQYDPRLDSAIRWDIKPLGFNPVLLRFDFDRPAALGLLSAEIYGSQKLTFIRELLQNSVDAIDTRIEALRQTDTILQGRIAVKITTLAEMLRVEWADNGIGMDQYILENYLTKIGRSWYQSSDFRRRAFAHDPISKFGIGLLSCFEFSTSLELTTKREQLLAKDPLGWRVRIPTRDGYFRVSQTDQANVGTTVVLEIPRTNMDLTATKIADRIKRIGSLIRYAIHLQVDGAEETINPITEREDSRLPFITLASLNETALDSFRSLTIQLNHHYVSADGGYEAFFSCFLPRDLGSVTSLGYRKWGFKSGVLDFEDFMIGHPVELFLKGIASDSAKGRSRGDLNSLAINVLKPSLVRPDLSRAQIDVRSLNLRELWTDVASHIREVVGPDLRSTENRVYSLSVASRIASLPDEALTKIVPITDWPVWTVGCGGGLHWRDASAVTSAEEVIEAPDELRYILSSEQYFNAAVRHVEHWNGPPCFVALESHSTVPWWAPATSLARSVLGLQGFTPTDLLFVKSGTDDNIPIACVVWRKQPEPPPGIESSGFSALITAWRKNPEIVYPRLVSQILSSWGRSSKDGPLLLRFPENMDKVAAIGSLYWNQNNSKIREIVELLLEVSVRFRRGDLPGRVQSVFQYLNSSSYLGYVVPARHSGSRAAMDRYREMLETVEKEGVPIPKALGPDDFLPGSVGDYWNPYHYPIWAWPKSHGAVGTPWESQASVVTTRDEPQGG